jgi:hypothetical protein
VRTTGSTVAPDDRERRDHGSNWAECGGVGRARGSGALGVASPRMASEKTASAEGRGGGGGGGGAETSVGRARDFLDIADRKSAVCVCVCVRHVNFFAPASLCAPSGKKRNFSASARQRLRTTGRRHTSSRGRRRRSRGRHRRRGVVIVVAVKNRETRQPDAADRARLGTV